MIFLLKSLTRICSAILPFLLSVVIFIISITQYNIQLEHYRRIQTHRFFTTFNVKLFILHMFYRNIYISITTEINVHSEYLFTFGLCARHDLTLEILCLLLLMHACAHVSVCVLVSFLGAGFLYMQSIAVSIAYVNAKTTVQRQNRLVFMSEPA